MKKNNKHGFTLIELLAVIVILAIIALITVPLILNVIETAKKGSFKDTAYGLIESAELYYSKQQLQGNNSRLKIFTFPEDNELNYKGETPKSGNLAINKKGQIALAISNDKYCIMKGFPETEVTVLDEFDECEIDIDTSGANEPDLLENMIPIKYDGENWKYARESQSWYNYSKKQWGNAVVLNEGITKKAGDIISEDEVALWYVWIPRYKYQLFNANNYKISARLINVEFEEEIETTGTVTCKTASNGVETCTNAKNGNWYTHPAFTLGEQDLTGIWFGKFELSKTNSVVTIKPSVRSWGGSTLSTYYTTIQGISNIYSINNGDSHMMKNIDWGAVAYLKQSKYGLGMTDIVDNPYEQIYAGGGTGIKNAYKDNINQTTTGNIYGIYDMSGGYRELVMGNMVSSSGTFYSSGSGFKTTLESKYYDLYAYENGHPGEFKRGHLGDATKEVLTTLDSNHGAWYNNMSQLPYNSFSWLSRGGRHSDYPGVFNFDYTTGSADSFHSTRAVLTRK